MGMIAPRIGAQKLGYNITAIPPGKRAFPFHNHHIYEEMFYAIEGTGEIRIGKDTFPIRPGDVIACPAGGKETAHQIIDTGDAELKYLAVSTKLSPEIAEYPDSGKFGVLAEYPAGADGKPRGFRFVGRTDRGCGLLGRRIASIRTAECIPAGATSFEFFSAARWWNAHG
jgi:uncharacterized cupin superfamily protein